MLETIANNLQAYTEFPIGFADHVKFEDDLIKRKQQRVAFINNEVYIPQYEYPKLLSLYDSDANGSYFSDLKRKFYEGTFVLSAALEGTGREAPLLELYRDANEYRLKRMMLVEAARRVHTARTSASLQTADRDFAHMNLELYGEFDDSLFRTILYQVRELLYTFTPASEREDALKQQLTSLLATEPKKLPQSEFPASFDVMLKQLHVVISNKYRLALHTIPNTDDSVYYNADQSVIFLNNFLQASGLKFYGWTGSVHPLKVRPVTDNSKRIFLPSNLRRTSRELRRLFIHEVEVHARRRENGLVYSVDIMSTGTQGFADVEEGLGVLLECAIEGSFNVPSFYRAQDRYLALGLALGRDGRGKRDARQTYEILWRIIATRNNIRGTIPEDVIIQSKNEAYDHIETAFRGTHFWKRGQVFMKQKLYYEGLVKNIHYFSKTDDIEAALKRALLGKYDHTDKHQSALISDIIESDTESDEEE